MVDIAEYQREAREGLCFGLRDRRWPTATGERAFDLTEKQREELAARIRALKAT